MRVKPDRIEWKPVGEFKVESGRIYVGDSWMILSGGVHVSITPGLYDIDAKWHWYGSDDHVACLRGRLRGAVPDKSQKEGEFGVDVASAGVVDAGAMDRWTADDEGPYDEWQREFGEGGHADGVGFHPCPAAGNPMLFTSTGFGDGCYEVWTLREAGRAVGFELRFLDDEGYVAEPPYTPTWRQKWIIAPLAFVLLSPFWILGLLVRWSNKLSKGR